MLRACDTTYNHGHEHTVLPEPFKAGPRRSTGSRLHESRAGRAPVASSLIVCPSSVIGQAICSLPGHLRAVAPSARHLHA